MADDDSRSSVSSTSADENEDTVTHQQPIEPGQVNEDPRLRSSGNGLEGVLAAHLQQEDSLGAPALPARSDIHNLGVSEPIEPARRGGAGAPPPQPVYTEPLGSADLPASRPVANVPTEPLKTEHEVAGTAQLLPIGGSVQSLIPDPDAVQLANNLHRGLDLGAGGLDLRLGGVCRDVSNGQTPGMKGISDTSVAGVPDTQEPTDSNTVAQVQSGADARPRSESFGRRLLNRFSKPLLRRLGHENAPDLPSSPADANGESPPITEHGSSSVTFPVPPLWAHSASQDMAQAGSHQRASSDGGMPSGRGRTFSSAWASLSATLSRASGPPPTRETSVVQPQPSSSQCQPRPGAALRERKSSTAVTKHVLKKSGTSSWRLLKKVAKEIRDLGDAYAAVVDQRAAAPTRGMMTQHAPAQLNPDYVSEADSNAADSRPVHHQGYDGLYDTSRSSSLPRGRSNNDANASADADGVVVDNDNLEHPRTAPEPPTDNDGTEAELGKKSLRQKWKSTWRRHQKREQNVIPGN